MFYYDIDAILSKTMPGVRFLPYPTFSEIDKIGSGNFATVQSAQCKVLGKRVVLKRFKNFEEDQDMFISEVRFIALSIDIIGQIIINSISA